MIFTGKSNKIIQDNGKFKLPAFFDTEVGVGMNYYITIIEKDWDNGCIYLRYNFADPFYEGEKVIASGVVNEDKIFSVPEEYVDIMKGPCEFMGTFDAFEVWKTPYEKTIVKTETE